MARASLGQGAMKLGVASVFVTVVRGLLVLSLVATTDPVHAQGHGRDRPTQEDALYDEDIDVEDIASRSVFEDMPRGAPDEPRPQRGPLWISLVGFDRKTIDERREVGGFVVVGLPLERLARGPAPRAASFLQAGGLVDPPLVRTGGTEAAFDLVLTPRLARGAVEAAWRSGGLGLDDARLDSLLSRARWSAVLPEARLRAVRFDDARLSLDTGTDSSRLRDSAGANIGLEARVTWRLDRLLYADDEPAIERIRAERRDARSRIAARTLEGLFHWQRAILDLRSLPPSQRGTRDEADVTLRVLEAEAALDVLTGGWFTARAGLGRLPPRPVARPGAEL